MILWFYYWLKRLKIIETWLKMKFTLYGDDDDDDDDGS